MKKMLLMFALVLGLGGMAALPVRADEAAQEVEITELNQIMVTNEAVEAKETPDDSAKTVITYENGVPVFVIGETKDGWYKVSYQDKEGYVPKSVLTMQEFDVEGIDREFQESEAEGKLVIEEVERYRAEARRSRIWGIVIVLLVVGIFATGIISTTRIEKEKKKKEAEESFGDSSKEEQPETAEVQTEDKEKEEIIDLDNED